MSSRPSTYLEVAQVREGSPLEPGSRFGIRGDRVVIGRSIQSDVSIPDPTISRAHIEMRFDDHGVEIESLTQKSVTVVNGQRVNPGARVRVGYAHAAVILGTVEFRFVAEADTLRVTFPVDASELNPGTAVVRDSKMQMLGAALSERYTPAIGVDPRVAHDSPPFLQAIFAPDSCVVNCRGQWLDLPRMAAIAIGTLCRTPGVPVSDQVIEKATASGSMVIKHISQGRSALKKLVTNGHVERADVEAQLIQFPGFDAEAVAEWNIERIFQKLIASYRGFGYVLNVPAHEVTVTESG